MVTDSDLTSGSDPDSYSESAESREIKRNRPASDQAVGASSPLQQVLHIPELCSRRVTLFQPLCMLSQVRLGSRSVLLDQSGCVVTGCKVCCVVTAVVCSCCCVLLLLCAATAVCCYCCMLLHSNPELQQCCMQECTRCVETANTIGNLLKQKQQLDEFALQGGTGLTAVKIRQMVNIIKPDRDQLATVEAARCALMTAVAKDELLAMVSKEYMARLDQHVQFRKTDMYSHWHGDKRLILEFENREHSYRMLIRQLALKCSVDVTFPVYWL